MEELLYILAGIAWLAYSIFGQSKKKKAQPYVEADEEQDAVEETPSIKTFFEQELNIDDFFQEVKPVEPEPEEILDSPISKIDVVEEKDPESYFKPASEGISSFKQEEETEDQDEIQQMFDLTEEDEEPIRFDAKKAIIYSEILNPPYIEN